MGHDATSVLVSACVAFSALPALHVVVDMRLEFDAKPPSRCQLYCYKPFTELGAFRNHDLALSQHFQCVHIDT